MYEHRSVGLTFRVLYCYIQDITTPLVRSGVLKERSKAEYEKDLKNFVVVIRDGKLVACGLLKQYGSNHAEIGCLAVHPSSCCHGLGEVRDSHTTTITRAMITTSSPLSCLGMWG